MKKFLLILFLIFNFSNFNSAYATSFVGGDLTYTCLGGNTYLITYAYYHDCSGGSAPTTVNTTFNCSSNQAFNFTATLNKIPGTGQEVTPGCSCSLTTCQGGTSFGVREYVYQGQVTLAPCNSWTISVSNCCRNTVSTVLNWPTGQFYIETTLNSLYAPCNSSPSFSNKPISIVCNGKSYCYNHGAIDPDGDSLAYSFSSPKKSSTTAVTYYPPYSVTNFLSSSSPLTLDPVTGDICFTPASNMSSITGIKVEQWRTINGVPTLIGTTQRDLQFRVKACPNEIPILSGIDTLNTHTYNPNDTIHNMSWAIGQTIDFDINGFDADTAIPNCTIHPENFWLSWNNGIPSATFTPFYSSASDSSYAHFQWKPKFTDVATSPHCFEVTIQDGACPYMGASTEKYCLTITSGVGIENQKNQQILNIYPNPSSGLFVIDFPTNSVTNCLIHIYNTEGKEVYQQEWKQANLNSNHKLDLSHLTNGVYYVSINQGDMTIKSKIVIKK